MHSKHYVSLFLILTLQFNLSFAQINPVKIRAFRKANEQSIMKEYLRFLSIPNETNDTANIIRNAEFVKTMLEKRGIRATFLMPAKGNPVVFGEVISPEATKTIIFYAHYDGQPVNPKQWSPGLKPFEPVFITAPIEQGGHIIPYKEGDPFDESWRISGRASADDKAGVMCIINAYEALIKSGGKSCNIKFFFEGEEEKGSPSLDEILKTNKGKLSSDIWIICDGPRSATGKKLLSYGVRGDVNMSLTIFGPKRPLHSGNFGNWAPNPGLLMTQLLAGMKDEKGHVLIHGFYDDVIPFTETEKNAISKIPSVEKTLKEELGIVRPDGDGKPLMILLNEPSLNINGVQSGNVGAMASNIIPAKAEAVLDLRLVPGNDYNRQVQKVVNHIISKGYYVIDHDPTQDERMNHARIIKIIHDFGYNAQRTRMDLPIANSVASAVQSTINYPLIRMPGVGGSLPLFILEKDLGANIVTIPLVNFDNNQHAENENVRLDYLWEGIETIAQVMQLK